MLSAVAPSIDSTRSDNIDYILSVTNRLNSRIGAARSQAERNLWQTRRDRYRNFT
jgi:hypothetical protein